MERSRIRTNGVELSCLTAGDRSRPMLLLLHGFPETALAWTAYLEQLQDRFFVVAPDQRGYATSDKPPRVQDYALDELAKDGVGLIDHFGKDRAFVVGHDWGAGVTWWMATYHPSRVQRFAVMNVPHPLVFRDYLFRHPRQLKKSWYMFFFQLPAVPERIFARYSEEKIRATGAFTEEEIAAYQKAWAEPGAVTSMINWYRATLRFQVAAKNDVHVEPEALIVWGEQDPYLESGMAAATARVCRSARVQTFGDATHWVNHEKANEVVGLIRDFCVTDET